MRGAAPSVFTDAPGSGGCHLGPDERTKASWCTCVAAGRIRRSPLAVFGLTSTAFASSKKPNGTVRIYGESVCYTV